MAATTTTRTRADDLRTFVELNALDAFLGRLLPFVCGSDLAEPDRDRPPVEMFSDQGCDAYCVGVIAGPTSHELEGQLWDIDTSTDDYENYPEWNQTNNQGTLLAGRLFYWLASDEGRVACSKVGQELLSIAARDLGREERKAA
jgi:hypothetical protein